MTSRDTEEVQTEWPNPRTSDIDRLDSLGILERLNDEDRLVAPAVRAALPELARAVDLSLERWRRGGRIVLFGAGTSGRLAMLDAAELGPTFGVPPDRYEARLAGGASAFMRAVEGAEDDRSAGGAAAGDLSPEDVAFGIAASGRTPWVIGALARAGELGALRIGLACVQRPQLAAFVDVPIVVDTGPEAIAGSTRMKAGTAQKLVLNGFSTALMIRLGKVYGNLMIDVQATNEKLRRRAVRLVREAAGVEDAVALEALYAAGWDVKVAVALLRLGISADAAKARLAESDGVLRRVLDEDSPMLSA
jgi:N-acetylmuramic acid 6-phosphate etherase